MAEPTKEGTEQKQVDAGTAAIIILVFVALMVAYFTGAFESDNRTQEQKSQFVANPLAPSTTEGKLAAIDLHSYDVPSRVVAQYATVLGHLQAKCSEPKARIGDFAVVGVESLKKKNVNRTILNFLKDMDGSIPDGTPDGTIRCAEIAAVLVTLSDN